MRILNIFFPFLFITSSKSFKFSHIDFKHVVNVNEKIYEKYDNLGEYKEYFEPNLFSTIHHLVDKSNIYQTSKPEKKPLNLFHLPYLTLIP